MKHTDSRRHVECDGCGASVILAAPIAVGDVYECECGAITECIGDLVVSVRGRGRTARVVLWDASVREARD